MKRNKAGNDYEQNTLEPAAKPATKKPATKMSLKPKSVNTALPPTNRGIGFGHGVFLAAGAKAAMA